MARPKNLKFVKSRSMQWLAKFTDVYCALEAAVAEADSAVSERLTCLQRLNTPKTGTRLSRADKTRDCNQRKYDYLAAILRQRASYPALCAAIRNLHQQLIIVQSQLNLNSGNESAVLKLNLVEACKLYAAANKVLSRFDDMNYEWTLDSYLDEEVKAAAAWLATMPEPPEYGAYGLRIDLAPAIVAHALVDHDGDALEPGGFLGGAEYASDVKRKPVNCRINVDSERPQAVERASKALRDHGYTVKDCEGGLQIRGPKNEGEKS